MRLAILLLLLATPAAAQSSDRYMMRPVPEGTLRLDTRTGETTLCTTDGGKLRCAVSAEEREAYEKEIDALGSRLEALEERLIALEPPEPLEEDEALDGSAGVDKAVGMAERLIRGFAGAVKRLRQDFETN